MSETDQYSIQRRGARVERVTLVSVSRVDEEGFRADLATGRTLNISTGGIRLDLDHPLPLHSVVGLTLTLGDDLLEVEGRVVYLEALDGQRSAMGIEFGDLSAAARERIEEYLARE